MKKITRQKIVDYDVYRAKDGKEFPSEQECLDYEKILDGKRIVCPDCNGKGMVNEHYEQVFDGGMYGDHQYHSYLKSDPCPKCKGKGYLEKKVIWE